MVNGEAAGLLLTFRRLLLLLLDNNMVVGKGGSRNKGMEVEKKRNECIADQKNDGGYPQLRLRQRAYRCLLLAKSSVDGYYRKLQLLLSLSSRVV